MTPPPPSATPASTTPALVAVLGNPNTGKSTVFNALTGARQKIANYPGVTVEKRLGSMTLSSGEELRLVDLPGCYSLAAQSPEELVAHDVLFGRVAGLPKPDAVLAVLNAANLSRNLYLLVQLLESGQNVVVALNMMDLLERNGIALDHRRLSQLLGVPVVPVVAARGSGLDDVRRAVESSIHRPSSRDWQRPWRLDPAFEELLADLTATLVAEGGDPYTAEGDALWLVSSYGSIEKAGREISPAVAALLSEIVSLSATEGGRSIPEQIIEARYTWIWSICDQVLLQSSPRAQSPLTQKLDAVLMHRVWGVLLFFGVIFVVFQALFAWSDPFIGLIETSLGMLTDGVRAVLPTGLLSDLVCDGILAGAGNVLVFLPQILILFLFMSLLEDSGYMARAAFLMEPLMARVGLHGKAFIPLMSGFSCAVPSVMGTRIIEKQEDRLLTILVLPLTSCSARLPVYTLITGALFSHLPPLFGVLNMPGAVMTAMYLLSLGAVLGMAALFRRTVVKGRKPPFLLELPEYKLPSPMGVAHNVAERGMLFVTQAGTVILALTIILWVLFTFPKSPQLVAEYESRVAEVSAPYAGQELPEALAETVAALEAERDALVIERTIAGRIGHAIEPVMRPLGFDWKMSIAILASFAAREVFVGTLGVVYGVGGDADEESVPLREHLRNEVYADGSPVYTPLVGLSVLVFFVLACQCMSTLAVIKRETNSWYWPTFVLGYMTALAYLASLVVYQTGRLLGWG